MVHHFDFVPIQKKKQKQNNCKNKTKQNKQNKKQQQQKKQTTQFIPVTEPARLPGSYEKPLLILTSYWRGAYKS